MNASALFIYGSEALTRVVCYPRCELCVPVTDEFSFHDLMKPLRRPSDEKSYSEVEK